MASVRNPEQQEAFLTDERFQPRPFQFLRLRSRTLRFGISLIAIGALIFAGLLIYGRGLGPCANTGPFLTLLGACCLVLVGAASCAVFALITAVRQLRSKLSAHL
jgi:hypothetical protein